MFRFTGQGILEQHDDPFASAVESLIFPVSQPAGFDFSAFAPGHQTTLSGLQGELLGSLQLGPVTDAVSTHLTETVSASTVSVSTSAFSDITLQPLDASALTFTLHNIGGVTPGSQAEAGFLRAAALWQSFLGDPVNIRLDVGFSSLGPGILGSTSSSSKVVSYSAVRTALTADQTSSDDATAVASLSSGSSLAFFTNNAAGARVFDNDGSGNNTALNVSTADLKALGLTTDTGAADGSITFSSDFTWDFDPSDGIAAGAIDFVGVAVHEIGHALGFTSGVDVVDANTGAGPGGQVNLNPFAVFSVLDLFRYSSPGTRDLSFGGSTYFSLNGGATNLALFSTGRFQGDGRQASHWKDNLGIGIMDPTSVPAGQANVITNRDIQALDVIGWNRVGTQAPSPGSISIGGMQIIEGNAGTKVGTFTVTRSGGTAAFAVNFATSDGTAATADNDYVANAGTLNFAAGVNTQTISVTIQGDTKFESDETFFANLSGATNGATISNNFAVGTILNDDPVPAPSVAINDVTVTEGNDGTKVATFTVTRSIGGAAFDVNFTTADNTATVADHDYVANSGTLHFGAGVNTQTIAVMIGGDTKLENSETFSVNLSAATQGAVISDNSALGTIADDDAGQPSREFNGDSHNDLLWHNDSGVVGTWDMNGLGYIPAAIATVSNDWHVAGAGDFNGDHKSDILWRNDSGTVGTWDMNDRSYSTAAIAIVPNDWHIAGTGDFSGDGKADILWRNDSGAVGTWDMNDQSYVPAAITNVSNDWHVAGIGDFNGDHKADILWLNDSGAVGTWDMNDRSYNGAVIANVPNDWHVAGTGDFNGDGKADILWRNDSGTVGTWDMNDHSYNSAVIADVSNDWHIAGTGDFNGDSKTDILWRNDDGSVGIWNMNDHSYSSAVIATATNDWHIV